jgi:hypothetical protein
VTRSVARPAFVGSPLELNLNVIVGIEIRPVLVGRFISQNSSAVMQELRALFADFASLSRFTRNQYVQAKSRFPLLQGIASRKWKVLPKEIPMWPSAIPLTVSLGRALSPHFNNVDGAVVLISLNTLRVALRTIEERPFNRLSESDFDDFLAITKAILQLLEDYSREPLNAADSPYLAVIEDSVPFMELITAETPDLTHFNSRHKTLLKDVEKSISFVRSQFKLMMENSTQASLTPLLQQLFLEMQPSGLFESMANNFSEFTFQELIPIEGSRALLAGDGDQALQIFTTVATDYEEAADRLSHSEEPMSLFRSKAAASIGAAARKLSNALKTAVFNFYYRSFLLPPIESVPMEFSSSIIRALQLTLTNQANPETTKQLVELLNNLVVDPDVQYLCRSAVAFPKEAPGFLALIGAYLPIDEYKKLKHLQPFLKIAQDFYCHLDTTVRARISEHPLGAPVIQEVAKLAPVSSLQTAIFSFAVLSGAGEAFGQAHAISDELGDDLLMLAHVLFAWILGSAQALRAAVLAFIPNAVSTIERTTIMSDDQIATIRTGFERMAAISCRVSTPFLLAEYLDATTSSMTAILPLIDLMIAERPTSLLTTQPEYVRLASSTEVITALYKDLDGALAHFSFQSPGVTRDVVSGQIRAMFAQIDTMIIALAEDPSTEGLILSQLLTQLPPFVFTFAALSADDVTFLSKHLKAAPLSDDLGNLLGRIREDLEKLIGAGETVRCSVAALGDVDCTNDDDLETVIAGMKPEMADATRSLVQALDLSGLFNVRVECGDRLLQVMALRLSGGAPELDLSGLANLADDDLETNALGILAALPTYAGDAAREIQKLALPLLTSGNVQNMRSALIGSLNFLTVTAPIQSRMETAVVKGGNGENLAADIDALLDTLRIAIDLVPPSVENAAIANAALLYTEGDYVASGEIWGGPYIDQMAFLVHQSPDVDEIEKIAWEVMEECVTTAARHRHFDMAVLYLVRNLYDRLDDFLDDPSITNKRILFGAILMLPPVFEPPMGTMTREWTEAVLYAMKDRTAIPELDRLIEMLGELPHDLDFVFGSLPHPPERFEDDVPESEAVPEPAQRIKKHRHFHEHRSRHREDFPRPISLKTNEVRPARHVRRVIMTEIRPAPLIVTRTIRHVKRRQTRIELVSQIDQLPSPEIRAVKLVEAARDTASACTDLLAAVRAQTPDISKHIANLQATGTALNVGIGESQHAAAHQISLRVLESMKETVAFARARNAPGLDGCCNVFEGFVKELISQSLEVVGIGNAAASELILMTTKVDALQARIETIDPAVMAGSPIGQLLGTETRELLRLARNLGREAQAQSEFLARSNKAVATDRGLINAAVQTADACGCVLHAH